MEGVMSSASPFQCDHEKIEALEEAFNAAWAVIQANDPDRDLEHDCERMASLSQKLAEISADGITNPAELERLALEAWPALKEETRQQEPAVRDAVP
jgi:hypothetical protein